MVILINLYFYSKHSKHPMATDYIWNWKKNQFITVYSIKNENYENQVYYKTERHFSFHLCNNIFILRIPSLGLLPIYTLWGICLDYWGRTVDRISIIFSIPTEPMKFRLLRYLAAPSNCAICCDTNINIHVLNQLISFKSRLTI